MTCVTILSLTRMIFLHHGGQSTLRLRRFTNNPFGKIVPATERIVQAAGKIVPATERIIQAAGKIVPATERIVQASSGFCQHIIPLSEKW